MAGERNTNTPAAQGASQKLDQFKYEVANEMGLQLGGDQTDDSIRRRTSERWKPHLTSIRRFKG